jgi:predicted nuclease of predicted toxin-antitoxin system
MIKLLIDECLSTELVSLAIAAGYAQSNHVTWLGKRGIKDWHLINIVVQYDWTFVTNNS